VLKPRSRQNEQHAQCKEHRPRKQHKQHKQHELHSYTNNKAVLEAKAGHLSMYMTYCLSPTTSWTIHRPVGGRSVGRVGAAAGWSAVVRTDSEFEDHGNT